MFSSDLRRLPRSEGISVNGENDIRPSNIISCSWPRFGLRFIIYAALLSMVALLIIYIFQPSTPTITSTSLPSSQSSDPITVDSDYSRPQPSVISDPPELPACTNTPSQQIEIESDDPEEGTDFSKQKRLFPMPSVDRLLDKTKIPNVVHYIWCESGYFEFRHYVSVLSVVKLLQPDIVVFHLTNEPVLDVYEYNDWWQLLRRDLPNLIVNEVTSKTNCSTDESLATEMFVNFTQSQGGIYMANGVILSKAVKLALPAEASSLSYSYPNENPKASGIGRKLPAILLFRPNTDVLSDTVQTSREDLSKCIAADVFDGGQQTFDSPCVYYSESLSPFYPRDVWKSMKPLGQLARRLVYNVDEPLLPAQSPRTLVPLICHYIWLGGGELQYVLYLSILSSLHVLKADAVLVHGELEPKGQLWKELLAMGDARLSYVYRPQQTYMYGRKVTILPLMADIIRADLLLKYGGIYTDWDAVWTKPLDDEIRSYDAVLGADWPDLKPFPETINIGTMLAKPGSAFVKRLQEGFFNFKDGIGPLSWCFVCLKAYKVLEQYPNLAYLHPHLQVIGYLGRYHPIWQPGSSENKFDGNFDWRTETYAIHWTFPTPKEVRSKAGLVKSKSSNKVTEVARFILEKAGIAL